MRLLSYSVKSMNQVHWSNSEWLLISKLRVLSADGVIEENNEKVHISRPHHMIETVFNWMISGIV